MTLGKTSLAAEWTNIKCLMAYALMSKREDYLICKVHKSAKESVYVCTE
jgi:hypothetical protein